MWRGDTRHYVTKGATGAGVRLLIQFLVDEAATPQQSTHGRHSRVRVGRAVRR